MLFLLARALSAPPIREPTVAGVIERSKNVNGAWRYVLRSGRYERWPSWYYAVPREGDCWVLVSQAQDLGSEVWFRFGLRLPKADGFESPGIPSLNMHGGAKFCINERGEVVRATLAQATD